MIYLLYNLKYKNKIMGCNCKKSKTGTAPPTPPPTSTPTTRLTEEQERQVNRIIERIRSMR